MSDKRSGKEGHVCFRYGGISKLPEAAIDGIQAFFLAGQNSYGHAAADNFSIRRHISSNVEVGLRSARMGAESHDDFIKNKKAADLLGQLAQLMQKVARLQIGVAAL